MHGSLAGWYEAQPPGEDAPGPELLAHHWTRAEQPERAAPCLEKAGRQALRHGAFREAVQMLGDAIDATPNSSPQRRALQEKALADAHYFLGDLPRSRALLEQALERLGHPVGGGRLELARGLASYEPLVRPPHARVAIIRAQLCADPARRKVLLAEPLRALDELGQERELARAQALLG